MKRNMMRQIAMPVTTMELRKAMGKLSTATGLLLLLSCKGETVRKRKAFALVTLFASASATVYHGEAHRRPASE